MGLAAILFNCAEQFEEIDNVTLTERHMRHLENNDQAVSEKKTKVYANVRHSIK